MSSSSIPVQLDAQVPTDTPPPLLTRIGQTFFSPGKLFSTFTEEETPWLGPLLVLMLLIGLTVLAQMWIIPTQLWMDYFKTQFAEAGQQVPPDEMLVKIVKSNQIIGLVVGPLAQLLVAFLAGGVLTMVFSLAMGGRAKFRQYMGVVTHSMFIAVLGLIAVLPLQIQSGDLELSPGLHLLFSDLNHKGLLYILLSNLDIFTVWTLLVVGVGVAAINRKREWFSSAAIVFAIFLVLKVGGTLLLHAVTGHAAA